MRDVYVSLDVPFLLSRDCAQLLHQAQLIGIHPVFDDFALSNTIDEHHRYGYRLTGCRDTEKFPSQPQSSQRLDRENLPPRSWLVASALLES